MRNRVTSSTQSINYVLGATAFSAATPFVNADLLYRFLTDQEPDFAEILLDNPELNPLSYLSTPALLAIGIGACILLCGLKICMDGGGIDDDAIFIPRDPARRVNYREGNEAIVRPRAKVDAREDQPTRGYRS